MTVAALLARAQFRNRWRTWIAIVLLVGAIGGGVIATLAGARRTETAYERFLIDTKAFDVLVTNGGTTPENANRLFDFAELAARPEVVDAAKLYYYAANGSTGDGTKITEANATPLVSADGRFGRDLNAGRLLAGRMPVSEYEIAVSTLLAENLGVQVGDTMDLRVVTQPGATGPNATFTVVGEVAMQSGFPPATGGIPPVMLLAPAYALRHAGATELFAFRLRAGEAGIPAFERLLAEQARGEPIATANRTEFASVQRSLDVQATALRIVALLLAVGALLVFGQVFARLGFEQASGREELRALGVTRGQRRGAGALTGMGVALAAAVVAGIVAVAVSPLTPVGLARRAETNPGFELNVAHVGIGVLGVLVAMTLLGALYAALAGRSSAEPRPARAHGRLRRASTNAGLSLPAACGVGMAFDPGHGRAAVPVRSTIATVVVAIAMIVGLVGFTASLKALFDDPALLGWNWDVQVGDAFTPPLDADAARLATHPAADAVAIGNSARVQIDGELVDTLATEPRLGVIEPTVVAGRAPKASNEIMLGTRTLRDLDRDIGDTLDVHVGDRSAPFVVVGRGVLADFAGGARLGQGAAVTLEGMQRLNPNASGNIVLLRVKPGPAGDALLAELASTYPGSYHPPTRPSDISDLERSNSLPAVLTGLLALLGIATLAHALVSSVQRRRRDLAVLKVIGFVRRDIASTVVWQAATITVVGIVMGAPLGILAGRWAWQVFANELGVPARPEVPWPALATVVAATALVALATAALPSRAAARTSAAVTLRME